MKKLATVCAVLGATVVLSACASNEVKTTDLAGHRFVLVTANDQTLANSIPPVIEFIPEVQSDKLKVVGKMCNNFNGLATYNDGVLQADGLAMTRAICSETALNMLDIEIGKMFAQGIQVSKTGDQLILKSGTTTLTYRQQDIKQ